MKEPIIPDNIIEVKMDDRRYLVEIRSFFTDDNKHIENFRIFEDVRERLDPVKIHNIVQLAQIDLNKNHRKEALKGVE